MFKLAAFTVKISNTSGISFFIHMSIVQTVAMATNNRKDNHFFAIFHTVASFPRVTLVKISYAYQRPNGTIACSKFKQRGKSFCLTYKLFLEILGHMFGDEIQKKENLPYGWLAHWK